MNRISSVALTLSLSLLSTPAWSQKAKGSPAPAESARTPPPPPSKESEGTASGERAADREPDTTSASTAGTFPDVEPASDYEKRRRQALIDYKVGEVDAALAELRDLVATCEKADTASCPDATRAKLYVALAIVLAGGKDDIKGAARLFHAALTRDPAVTVPKDLATRPVQEAMREANESTSYEELSGDPQSTSESTSEKSTQDPTESSVKDDDDDDDDNDDNDDKEEEDENEELPSDNKTNVLLLHALFGTGSDDFSDAPSYGAAAVLGTRFVDSSAWTTAIRGRVAIVGFDEEVVGGAALLMGGTWYNQKRKRMGYFLGGIGLDSYGGEGGVSVNGMGGVSLGGFLIGGGVDIGASDYGSFAMIALHLGWGARL